MDRDPASERNNKPVQSVERVLDLIEEYLENSEYSLKEPGELEDFILEQNKKFFEESSPKDIKKYLLTEVLTERKIAEATTAISRFSDNELEQSIKSLESEVRDEPLYRLVAIREDASVVEEHGNRVNTEELLYNLLTDESRYVSIAINGENQSSGFSGVRLFASVVDKISVEEKENSLAVMNDLKKNTIQNAPQLEELFKLCLKNGVERDVEKWLVVSETEE